MLNIFIFYRKKNMLLKELIKIEETWLMYDLNHKFDMDFNQYLKFTKKLKEIGEITHHYFLLVSEYNAYLASKENLSLEEKKKELEIYNDKLLNSEVEFSFPKLDISKLK